jgi:hypothetical protein
MSKKGAGCCYGVMLKNAKFVKFYKPNYVSSDLTF